MTDNELNFESLDPEPILKNVWSSRETVDTFLRTAREGKAGDTIELTNRIRQFLIDYKNLIDYVAVSGWVRFTEGYTSAPEITRQNRWY